MAYLDYSEYAVISGEVSETDFPSLDRAAENIIDLETQYQINDLSTLPVKVQTLIKKAVAAQIDYLGVYGIDVAFTASNPQGFTVGKVKVESGSSTNAKFSVLSPIAESILELTGLLSRHVHVVGDPFAPWPLGVV